MAAKPKQPEPPKQLLADAKATEEFLERHFSEISDGPAPKLREAMAYAVLGGGKRIRAALVLGAARLAASEATGAEDAGDGLRVAAAFECLHAYSLIHDDLPAMDDAGTRRGKPACHIAFDEATAILAGDALQALAFEFLTSREAHADPEVRAGLVLELAWAAGAKGMAGGQMLDLEAEANPPDRDATDAMQRMKTGALINAAVRCGGMVGGADDDLLSNLHNYAGRVGVAFQIADDILDRTASTESLGKPAGHDEQAGKASHVDFLGLEGAQIEAERLVEEAGSFLAGTAESSAPEVDYLLELASFCIKRGR